LKVVKIDNPDGWGLDGVGESYRPGNWKQLVGSTPLNQEFKQQVLVTVVPEKNNPHDKNAVALYVDGIHLGYLSGSDAKKYRPEIDRVDEAGAKLIVQGNIWWVRRPDGLKANIRVNLPNKWKWDGETQDIDIPKQIAAAKSLKAEWWTAIIAMLIMFMIPNAGIALGILVLAVFGFLITTGRFRYNKSKQ
jgi:hypothetical protein